MQEGQYTIPQMVDDVRTGKMPRRHFVKALTTMGISAAGVGTMWLNFVASSAVEMADSSL